MYALTFVLSRAPFVNEGHLPNKVKYLDCQSRFAFADFDIVAGLQWLDWRYRASSGFGAGWNRFSKGVGSTILFCIGAVGYLMI
mmetsp:Transcript_24465/g.36255  ORF Transcript_24465/g.36255 Transcript_24465/m.36255 type:complete len:84 (-) Transcript_24465:395-646(-)